MSKRFDESGGTVAVYPGESLPECDLCKLEGRQRQAEYDGATTRGPWAYMCSSHFIEMGVGLGVGRGQKLVLDQGPPRGEPL